MKYRQVIVNLGRCLVARYPTRVNTEDLTFQFKSIDILSDPLV